MRGQKIASKFVYACVCCMLDLLLHDLSGISGNSEQKNILQTTEKHTIQLFVAIKGHFSGLFFF